MENVSKENVSAENTPVEIDRIIGICIGIIGLSLSDTYRLTLDEFNILYEEWDRYRTIAYRTSWEQTRFIAQCALLPYAKRSFRPTDLITFDWERSPVETSQPATREDFERMRARFGEE